MLFHYEVIRIFEHYHFAPLRKEEWNSLLIYRPDTLWFHLN